MLNQYSYIALARLHARGTAGALLLSLALVTLGCGNGQVTGDPALADPSAPSSGLAAPAGRISNGGGSAYLPQSANIDSYTLAVDSPTNASSVHGTVVVSGHAPGFTDLEVWDASGVQLAQAPVYVDGAFSANVDTARFSAGATTWTVNAFDGLPSLGFQHSAHVELALTIEGAAPAAATCAGISCSGHGTCVVVDDQATCQCDAGYSLAALDCQAGALDPGTAYVPPGYHLAFSDEFSGAMLDTNKWNTVAPWNVKWYADSHQLQAFIPEAVTLEQGTASFTADHSHGNTDGQPYASGSITTRRTFTYGYFETRVSLPAGKGFWPAYWLTSSVRWPPELDIFEVVDGVDYGYTHTVPGGAFSFIEGAAGAESRYPLSNAYGVYHVYGFQWTATDLDRYVDGTLTEHDAIDAAAGSGDPFWLNLSLQVGGDWPGAPDASTPFPSHMKIDYVRVYEQ